MRINQFHNLITAYKIIAKFFIYTYILALIVTLLLTFIIDKIHPYFSQRCFYYYFRNLIFYELS